MHHDVNAALARFSADERRGAAVRPVPPREAGTRPRGRRRRGAAYRVGFRAAERA